MTVIKLIIPLMLVAGGLTAQPAVVLYQNTLDTAMQSPKPLSHMDPCSVTVHRLIDNAGITGGIIGATPGLLFLGAVLADEPSSVPITIPFGILVGAASGWLAGNSAANAGINICMKKDSISVGDGALIGMRLGLLRGLASGAAIGATFAIPVDGSGFFGGPLQLLIGAALGSIAGAGVGLITGGISGAVIIHKLNDSCHRPASQLSMLELRPEHVGKRNQHNLGSNVTQIQLLTLSF